MKTKVHLEIGKKVHENNENWAINKNWEMVEKREKKKWFVRLRDKLTVKKFLSGLEHLFSNCSTKLQRKDFYNFHTSEISAIFISKFEEFEVLYCW